MNEPTARRDAAAFRMKPGEGHPEERLPQYNRDAAVDADAVMELVRLAVDAGESHGHWQAQSEDHPLHVEMHEAIQQALAAVRAAVEQAIADAYQRGKVDGYAADGVVI